MPRWLWWAPMVLLTFVAGLFVFRLGWIRAHMSETDVINHYAARYVAQTGEGAKMSDCEAVPGQTADVWIVVRCQHPFSRVLMRFPVNRAGRLVEVPGGGVLEPAT